MPGTGLVLRAAAIAFGLAILPSPQAMAQSFETLRGEGLTLYLRHASADWGDSAPEAGSLDASRLEGKACAPRRKLTEEGRMQAQAVRAALQSLNAGPIDVYAVGLCRTYETAKAIGQPVRIVEAMTPAPGAQPSMRMQGDAIEKIVRAGQSTRGLRVVVGDYEAPQALFGATLAEGDGLVLKAGRDGVEPVARIRAGDWMALQPVASGDRNSKF